MWKEAIVAVSTAMLLGHLLPCPALADDSDGPATDERSVTNIILEDKEVVDLKIQKQFSYRWVRAIDPQGALVVTPGWEQFGVVGSVRINVRYAEFGSDAEAHDALEFSAKNCAAVFKKGLWDGAHHKAIADESWFTRNMGNAGLKIRSGPICVSVAAMGGDAEKRPLVAETLAKHIADKMSAGAKLILPKEAPPE